MDRELISTELRTTCYLFFKNDDPDQKSITKALSALLHQLFSQRKELLQHAIPEYTRNGSNLPSLFDTLWTILMKAAADSEAGEIICILDALDECEMAGKDLIEKLCNFHSAQTKTNTGLKFLVTSRPYSYIE